MALLLDTSGLPQHLRSAAITEAFAFSGVPIRLMHKPPGDDISARLEYFTLGAAHLLRTRNSPMGFVTTAALLRNADNDTDLLAASLAPEGLSSHTHAPGRVLRGGDLIAANLWRPFEFCSEGTEHTVLYVRLRQLGLPRDYVTRASEAVHLSPLAAQLQEHLKALAAAAETIARGPAAPIVGQASADLVRAVLLSSLGEEPFGCHDAHSQLTLIKSFISHHLADADLGAERIARAMFISPRQVYKLWDGEALSLGQWILGQRLEAAREELRTPHRRSQSIAATATKWGFTDATHFSRRFRQAFGMSPREWRMSCLDCTGAHAPAGRSVMTKP
jgi:AraC-like DNA-binding protein